jgi:hypothetical protein
LRGNQTNICSKRPRSAKGNVSQAHGRLFSVCLLLNLPAVNHVKNLPEIMPVHATI